MQQQMQTFIETLRALVFSVIDNRPIVIWCVFFGAAFADLFDDWVFIGCFGENKTCTAGFFVGCSSKNKWGKMSEKMSWTRKKQISWEKNKKNWEKKEKHNKIVIQRRKNSKRAAEGGSGSGWKRKRKWDGEKWKSAGQEKRNILEYIDGAAKIKENSFKLKWIAVHTQRKKPEREIFLLLFCTTSKTKSNAHSAKLVI